MLRKIVKGILPRTKVVPKTEHLTEEEVKIVDEAVAQAAVAPAASGDASSGDVGKVPDEETEVQDLTDLKKVAGGAGESPDELQTVYARLRATLNARGSKDDRGKRKLTLEVDYTSKSRINSIKSIIPQHIFCTVEDEDSGRIKFTYTASGSQNNSTVIGKSKAKKS